MFLVIGSQHPSSDQMQETSRNVLPSFNFFYRSLSRVPYQGLPGMEAVINPDVLAPSLSGFTAYNKLIRSTVGCYAGNGMAPL